MSSEKSFKIVGWTTCAATFFGKLALYTGEFGFLSSFSELLILALNFAFHAPAVAFLIGLATDNYDVKKVFSYLLLVIPILVYGFIFTVYAIQSQEFPQ